MKPRQERLVRFLALCVVAVSLTYMTTRARTRADVTAEGLSQITPATLELIEGIAADRPVTVHAFVSRDVPGGYATVQAQLLNILREMEARGGPGLTVRIVQPDEFSPEADEALESFGIEPRPVAEQVGGRINQETVFLGLAFVSGPREEVIPFMERGLSIEYEIARALRVVTQEKKKVLGILRTDATIMGNFDIQSRSQQPAWQIIDDLRRQYDVRSLNPKQAVPEDVDVLFVPQLSSCGQDELEHVRAYIDAGRPALLTIDPLPAFDIRLSPKEERLPDPSQGGGGMMGGGPPAEPKGDYQGLLRDVGIEWPDDKILYDTYNPHPMLERVPEQFVFVRQRPDGTDPFTGAGPVVEGLEEIVILFGGELKPAPGYQDKFVPILQTGKTAGYSSFDDMVARHPLFGLSGPMPPKTRSAAVGKPIVMGARVRGGGDGEKKDRNLAVIADLDLFGDLFYGIHERGGDIDGDGVDEFRFDNVTFLLNLIDELTGDDRFIELRKRKPAYRRLTTVDDLTKEAREQRGKQTEEANAKAESEMAEAQKALDASVAAIRDRTDLDDNTKAIMLKSAEEAENRRLAAKQEAIEREKKKALRKTQAEHRREVDDVQNRIRVFSVLLPPIPALLLGAWIFGRKRRRERETIPQERRTGAADGKESDKTTGGAR